MKKKDKQFWVDIIVSTQLEAVMDLPGYSHVTEEREQLFRDMGYHFTVRTACFVGVNKGELQKALRTLPGYQQGFNVIQYTKEGTISSEQRYIATHF